MRLVTGARKGRQPRMHAPGIIIAPEYQSNTTGLLAFIFIILFIGVLALCALSASNPGYLFFVFTSPIWVGFIMLMAKLMIAGSKPTPQEILRKAQYFVDREEYKLTRWAQRDTVNAADSITGSEGAELAILGSPITGDLVWCCGDWLTIPERELSQHGVIIGASGSGKTVTLLRLVYLAAMIYGYKVFFVDAKPSRQTAARFLALTRTCGIHAAMFPRQQYNGWIGDPNALINRLMAIVDFSDPYYKSTCKRVLTAICRPMPPRNSIEFLDRLDTLDLAVVPGITRTDLGGVQNRYHAFFDLLDGQLDGSWCFDNVAAGYILLDGTALKEEASSLGRYVVEDFGHYCTTRKPREHKVLLIIDEYSAISQSGADTANLFEHIRESGGAILVSGQGYASMGDDIERMLDAANFYIVHRSAAPDRITERAGTARRIEEMRNFGGNLDQQVFDSGTAQWKEAPAIHPNKARQLATGQAIIISHGEYAITQIAPAPEPDQSIIQQAITWINQQPAPSFVIQSTSNQPALAPQNPYTTQVNAIPGVPQASTNPQPVYRPPTQPGRPTRQKQQPSPSQPPYTGPEFL